MIRQKTIKMYSMIVMARELLNRSTRIHVNEKMKRFQIQQKKVFKLYNF